MAAAASPAMTLIEALEILGNSDDEYATIEYTVTANETTTGPYTAHVVHGQVFAQIPLQPGVNVIDVTARDAAGNVSVPVAYTVIRTENAQFHITSPAPDQPNNAPTIPVGGRAPAGSQQITVNGWPATGAEFEGEVRISLEAAEAATEEAAKEFLRGENSLDQYAYAVSVSGPVIEYVGMNEHQGPLPDKAWLKAHGPSLARLTLVYIGRSDFEYVGPPGLHVDYGPLRVQISAETGDVIAPSAVKM